MGLVSPNALEVSSKRLAQLMFLMELLLNQAAFLKTLKEITSVSLFVQELLPVTAQLALLVKLSKVKESACMLLLTKKLDNQSELLTSFPLNLLTISTPSFLIMSKKLSLTGRKNIKKLMKVKN